MFVVDLIQKIPDDTHDRVKKACRRLSPIIREAIRSETRLRLTPRRREFHNSRARGEVRVLVDTVGYPEELKQVEIPEQYRLSAILALWQPTLTQLRDSSSLTDRLFNNSGSSYKNRDAEFVLKMLPEISPLLSSINDCHKLAETLLSHIQRFDLIEYILRVNENILGHYVYYCDFFFKSSGHVSEEVNYKSSSKVFVYWGVIGLFSMALNVSVENITAVVLAHELAHAYTHLGYDIDQYRWGALNYSDSDREVKEGLAQYYAERVIVGIEERFPGCKIAFDRLLAKLPPAYREHRPWIQKSTPEAVRNTLVLLRKYGPVDINQFGEHLYSVSDDYKRV